MYRKPSGEIGVSFTRFMNNAAPSFMMDSTADPGHISLPQRDMFYSHQMASPNPYPLNEESLHQSGILGDSAISRKTFQKLQKTGVLDEHGNVDTMKIGPNFTHDVAVISAIRQKQVIDLLFWWEEECHRLRKLEGEKAELETLAGEAKASGHAEEVERVGLLLDRVNLKIGMRPSQRREDLERDEDDAMVRLRSGGGGDAGGPAARQGHPAGEAPPEYTR